MSAAFLVVPEWQGSPSARALRLIDGAFAIAADLPSSATTVVEVPLEAGDALGTNVERLSSVQEIRSRHAEALAAATGTPITIGGDCGVALAAVEHVLDDDLAVVWFDAHPDLNTPDSSPSGAFSGMVLRTLLGDGPESLVPERPLDAARIVLAGTRTFDWGEAAFIEERGIPVVECASPDGAFADRLIDAVARTGARRVHIHVDVDVIDPAEFAGKYEPVPFGLPGAELTGAIRALLTRFPLAGASISEFAPVAPEETAGDLAQILRVIGALTAGLR